MNFFNDTCKIKSNLMIHIHPLLFSLSETINESETNPMINNISENDRKALRSSFYTSPGAFPPLGIHFSGQNGSSPLIEIDMPLQYIGSWLPRMYGICPSGQPNG